MIPLYDKKINRKVRVFISSTFSDMQKERNIIVHSVFPRLRKVFSSKFIDITEVDLRWGIPEEDSENSRILEICIGEVLHCSPFFVGMIGNRYGSIASDEAINDLPPAYKKALGNELPSGLSITELEMRAGVFVPNNIDFSCFFIKSDVMEEQNLQPEIHSLISNITNSYEMFPYSDESEFEEVLYNSLFKYITKVIPESLTVPYKDNSYFSHLKLLKNNNYRYISDNYFIASVERKINQYRCVYILGQKGMGKSACLSYLIKEEGIERNGNVFFHFAAAGSQSVNIENVFFRLRLYLQSEFGFISNEDDNYNAVIDIIKSDVVNKRIVLFFDALDQLDDVTAIYKFFKLAELNSYVHIVCSGTKEYSRIFGEQVVIIKPLSPDQIAQITNGTLTQFGKKLSRRKKQEILNNKNCSNPLFLRAFLSQLIMYGTYSSFDIFFDKLLEVDSFGKLFSVVISRVRNYFEERNNNADQVYDAIALMVYSNNGVKESELQEILNLLPVERSIFLTAIELFTIEDNGLIRFNHDLINISAKNILSHTGKKYDVIAAELFIKYFHSHDEDWRKNSEMPYQLRRLERADELLEQITVLDCYLQLSKHEYHSLIGYLSYLVDHQMLITKKLMSDLSNNQKIRFAEIMCQAGCHNSAISVVSDTLENETVPETRIHLMDILARSQYKLGLNHFQSSINTYKKLLEYFRSEFPEDSVGYASRAYLLGIAYKSSGEFKLSIDILEKCKEIFQRNQVISATSLWVLDVYGQTLYTTGKLKKALETLDSIISDCTFLFGEISAELAWAYCYGWNILYTSGDKTNSIEMVRKAYMIYDLLYMGSGTKIAWASSNAGTASLIEHKYNEAEDYYLFSIKENDCIIPEDQRPHPYSLTTYADLAQLYEKTDCHEKAVKIIRFTLDNSYIKNGSEHIYYANILLIDAIIENDPTKAERAGEIYKNQNIKTPDVFFAQVCLARIYVRLKKSYEAEMIICQCAKEYFQEEHETDLITYLILDSMEKITGNLDDDMFDMLDELYRFEDFEYYLTHNNNSQIILIPKI